MPKFVIEVTAHFHDIIVSADTLEEAMEIAKMGAMDRWPDEVTARPQIQWGTDKAGNNYPITTDEGYLGC